MKTLRVTAKTLVMRSGPGRNCLRRTELHEGDILIGLGRDVVFAEGANWLAIETASSSLPRQGSVARRGSAKRFPMPDELAAWGVPAIAIALLSTGTTLTVQWLSRNVRKSEAGKNDAEAELMGAQTAAAVMSMSREMMAELRGEVERQKQQYEEELRTLRAAVAALEAEQETQRQQYQGRIDALEAKIAVLQAELERERELRRQLEAKHEAGEEF